MKRLYILLFTVFSLNITYAQNSTQTIIDDMTSPPDAALHGVPSYYSWASGAVNGLNPAPAKNNQGEWFRAMTSWGQVYIPVEGSQASNTRTCEAQLILVDLQGYLLFQQQIMQEKAELSLASLAKGVYIVKVRNDFTIITGKVVKE